MSKSRRVDVTVMVDDTHKGELDRVASGLKSHGFELAEALDAIGVLTGSVPEDAIDKLSRVKGVSAVEKNRTDYRPQ